MSKIFFDISGENFKFNHVHTSVPDPAKFALHTHDVPELLFIKQIDGCHIVEDREYPLSGMDLIIVPPAVHHTIKLYSDSPYDRYDICFDPGLPGEKFDRIFNTITVLNCSENRIINEIFRKADYYAEVFPKEEFESVSKLLITEVFYNILTLDSSDSISPIISNPILSKAVEYINQNIFTISSVTEISDALYVTESYLFGIFKKLLHTSPKKYINAKRLHAARSAIAMGEKPSEVFSRVGFGDYTSFYRSYVNFFGHSPSRENDAPFNGEKHV